jgi:hypothetical protein
MSATEHHRQPNQHKYEHPHRTGNTTGESQKGVNNTGIEEYHLLGYDAM